MNYLLNISDPLGVFSQIFTRPFQREQHDACLFSFYCVNKANFADRCGCILWSTLYPSSTSELVQKQRVQSCHMYRGLTRGF